MRVVLVAAAAAIIGAAQTPPSGGRSSGGGRGSGQPALPPPGLASVRGSGASLGTPRLGIATPIWFTWRVGIPAAAFRQLTFAEAAAKADALGLGSIEGFSSQALSPEVTKKLDDHLMPGERAATLNRLHELNVQMPVYHAVIEADESGRRKLFEFAKSMGVETIVASPDPAALPGLDQLAGEFGINVAIENRPRGQAPTYADPRSLLSALESRSKRIGASGDTGNWIEEGIKPVEALSVLKGRLMALNLRDRSALGPGGHDVTAGSGAADLPNLFLRAFRLELKPLFIAVDTTGATDTYADLSQSLAGMEKALRPAMKARVAQVVDSPEGAIRSPDRLPPEMRQQIDAAVPRHALVPPKKPRKLLVVDLQMYTGHATILHGNLLIDLLAKYTGAFQPVFSNDLNNLKYDKIRQFDAVFLNSVVGMVFEDQEVRDGLIRYVREGGGLGGVHGTTYAALDWPEFTDMLGGSSGEHHTETLVLKVDDPASPLTTSFHGKSFEHTDEFYHMPMTAPYSREKEHVLLSIDVEKSDMATNGRFCPKCTRPDQDYAMSWIRNYGKGRVFCTSLGHTPILFTQPVWTQHLFAGIQFILGDLEADATPSARLSQRKK